MNNSLLLIIEESYLQTFLHSLGKSALPICNYSQILYQFLTFTQNLKRSLIQKDYTSFSLYYQIKLPLDLEISIPSDDPVW